MKDEIKEIDRIIINVKRKLQFSPERRFVELFNKDEINKLLDYITNLQTIEQQYSAILSENAELENKITNLQEELQQEKKDFKETNDYCFELKDYKSRNEKAVKYIKQCDGKPMLRDYYDRYLLNILEGDKDE